VTITYGVFHLQRSLLTGLGAPLLILGLLGLASPWLAAPERRRPLFIISSFALLWYAVHELSPLKPYPDFQRYMVPLAPLLAVLGTAFVYEVSRRCFSAGSEAIAAAVIIGAALPSLHTSMLLAGSTKKDLRSIVPDVVANERAQIAFDHYTRFGALPGRSNQVPSNAESPGIFVTSSFYYDRFAQAGEKGQRLQTRMQMRRYHALFTKPYLEITNGRPAYGLFNPTMRIVALDGDVDQLKSIAAGLMVAAPNLSLHFANVGP
jgi:hypothetical protein